MHTSFHWACFLTNHAARQRLHEGVLAFVHFFQVKQSGAVSEALWDLLSSSCWCSLLLVCIASCFCGAAENQSVSTLYS